MAQMVSDQDVANWVGIPPETKLSNSLISWLQLDRTFARMPPCFSFQVGTWNGLWSLTQNLLTQPI